MNKEWSELNKTMQYQIKKRDTWHDGVITLINLRNQLSDTLFFFKFEQPWTTYFFIMGNDEKVGVIRVVAKKDGSRKRISPIWIMPEYRKKGYAQQAIIEAEKIYGSNHWCLDTILQEKGNLYLYEKLGYHQTGRIDKVKDHMDIVFYEKD